MNDIDDMINILVKERNQTLAEKENKINYYKNRYEDSQRELQRIRNQLQYKQDHINDIQNQLNNTKYQMNNNNQYQINFIQNQLNNTQNQLASTKAQLTNAQSLLINTHNQLTNTQRQLNNTQNQYQSTQYQLQNLQYSLTNTQNQLNISQNQLQIEKNTNNELRNRLIMSNQMISNQKVNIDSLNSEIENMRTKNDYDNKKVISLMEQIKQKENELTRLTFIITKFSKQLNPLSIIFRSMDSSINIAIYCYYSEIFSNVEERLYQSFPQLRNTYNLFLFNGKSIEKEKSVILNEIADKSVIIIASQS